jgi:manganese efflux pump family protein
MHFFEILIVALALSLDAFAVSLAAAISGHIRNKRAAFRLWFHFGLFQFLMPVLGWALGTTIEPVAASVGDWVAFALLAFVGVRMVRSGLNPSSVNQADDPTRGLVLVMLSVGTSIDALAVGLSLAMLHINVWYPSAVIGIVTATMCMIAIAGGVRLGTRLGSRAQVAGGIVLLLIAGRIVINHLL